MKTVCDRAALTHGIQVASGVVPHRSPKPVLACVKIEARKEGIILLATDLEVGIRYNLAKMEVEEPGEALLPADRLGAILREIEAETITVVGADQGAEITAPGARFKVLGDNPADFPNVPEFPTSGAFTVKPDDLLGMIRRVIFATARENTRYALNGVLWEVEGANLCLVATDGRRLSMARGKCKDGPKKTVQAIVPAKAMQLIERCLADVADKKADVCIALSEKDVLVTSPSADGGAWVAYSRLVEGHFPKYDDVIPKECDKKVTLGTAAFMGGVRKAALLTNEESRGIHLRFGADEVVLTSRTPEMGEAEVHVPATYGGEAIEIAFDPNFLVDALKAMDAEEFTFAFKGPAKPGVMTEGRSFTYVVMPISAV
jgi:DNA polymerase-3 subunit beta